MVIYSVRLWGWGGGGGVLGPVSLVGYFICILHLHSSYINLFCTKFSFTSFYLAA